MGGVKQRWLELENSNLSNIPDIHICIKHLMTKSLIVFFNKIMKMVIVIIVEKN